MVKFPTEKEKNTNEKRKTETLLQLFYGRVFMKYMGKKCVKFYVNCVAVCLFACKNDSIMMNIFKW